MKTFTIPIRTVSTLNLREHWRTRAKRAKEHRGISYAYAHWYKKELHLARMVRLVRVAPRKLDDDNLAASAKSLVDGIADAAGLNDREMRWEYAQERGRPREYAVRVEIIAWS